jgi:hypothetical protein
VPSNQDLPILTREAKGKQRERPPDAPSIPVKGDEPVDDLKQQAVEDIDLLIERVKMDQAASENEYRTRGDRRGKAAMA